MQPAGEDRSTERIIAAPSHFAAVTMLPSIAWVSSVPEVFVENGRSGTPRAKPMALTGFGPVEARCPHVNALGSGGEVVLVDVADDIPSLEINHRLGNVGGVVGNAARGSVRC